MMRTKHYTWLFHLFAAASVLAAVELIPEVPRTTQPSVVRPAVSVTSRPAAWQDDLTLGYEQARQKRQPVLVRAGATWCGWCKQLDIEIANPDVQKELARWTLVYVDVDRSPTQAQKLEISPIPALRIVTPAGRIVASQDGYLPAEELLAWLKQNHDKAVIFASDDLTADRPPNGDAVKRLVETFNMQDPSLREATIRRLIPHPDRAALVVVEAFAKTNLGVRLTALELLREWKAPIADVDPWHPATITEGQLNALRAWAQQHAKSPATRPTSLAPTELNDARKEIARLLLSKDATEANGINERLARNGEALLGEVREQLKGAADDHQRELLTTLRYRLVATPRLVLEWPEGLEHLASGQLQTRQRAIDELALRATPDDTPLLRELFSDADPLIREITLSTLQKIGGDEATAAIARLLDDPDPNVKAAVLKVLAQTSSAQLVPGLCAYMDKEKDPDLLVHAIRVLRAAKTSEAGTCLMQRLEHESWRVRAEATEALGELMQQGKLTQEVKSEIGVALIKRLDDADGFVISRAMGGLKDASLLTTALDPLLHALDRHPQLATDIVHLLTANGDLGARAMPTLRKLTSNADPQVRAATMAAMVTIDADASQKELLAALNDKESSVRIAGAAAFFNFLELIRKRAENQTKTQHTSTSSWTFFGITMSNAKPAEEATSRPASGTWLEQFRKGEHRPEWPGTMVESLTKMLANGSAEEQSAAALPLIALRGDAQALSVLRKLADADPNQRARIDAILPWLAIEKRTELFKQYAASQPQANQLNAMTLAMSEWPDPQAAGPLWELVAGENVSREQAAAAWNGLRKLYFGDNRYSPSTLAASRRQQAITDANEKLKSPSEWHRVLALALLVFVSPSDAAAAANPILDDAKSTPGMRRDGLQILLLSEPRPAATRTAVAMLADRQPELRKLALQYLTGNWMAMLRLRERIELSVDFAVLNRTSTDNKPEIPKAPEGLKAETLRTLLTEPDAEQAAQAGYLLALLQQKEGLDALVRYWRDRARNDDNIRRMVYTAIAATNDEKYVPVLEEIYRTFDRTNYEVRNLYWTIRGMDAKPAADLRKVIRQEVGMERLQ